jgi:hypothetical protein
MQSLDELMELITKRLARHAEGPSLARELGARVDRKRGQRFTPYQRELLRDEVTRYWLRNPNTTYEEIGRVFSISGVTAAKYVDDRLQEVTDRRDTEKDWAKAVKQAEQIERELLAWENQFRASLILEENERYPLLLESLRQKHEIRMARLPEAERYAFVPPQRPVMQLWRDGPKGITSIYEAINRVQTRLNQLYGLIAGHRTQTKDETEKLSTEGLLIKIAETSRRAAGIDIEQMRLEHQLPTPEPHPHSPRRSTGRSAQ